jgi:hypothetical protein
MEGDSMIKRNASDYWMREMPTVGEVVESYKEHHRRARRAFLVLVATQGIRPLEIQGLRTEG